MKINSIQIKNFKSFKDRTFHFNSKFTLLIGDNGTGKTTILEAISVALGGLLAGMDRVKTRNILPDEVRKETKLYGDATFTTEEQYPVEISCWANINDATYNWKRTLNGPNGSTTRRSAQKIIDYAHHLQNSVREGEDEIILPVMAYYSAARMWSQKRNKWKDPFEKEDISRFLGYTDCLDLESNMKLFVRWFRRMTLIQLQKNKKIGEFNAVINAIQTCLKGLHSEDVSIHYDLELEEVMVDFGEDIIPLRMMSAGYRSVIGMVADLAYRMALLNPQLREDATKETSGVVLIDEIDLHLHPKWQWRIISDLKRTFPKVHFIATTHAPIVIASCEDHEIIRLYEKGGEIVSDSPKTPTGWLIEDVLTEIMNADSRSPEIESQIERIRELYYKKIKSELTDQEAQELETVSNILRNQLPEGDPAVILAKMDSIEKDLFGK